MSEPIQTTPGGSVLVKATYNEAWEPPAHTPYEEQLNAHMSRWLGPVDRVFHEVMSDSVHIDVHLVMPTKEQPFVRLYTTGMSARPMHAPAGAENLAHAELMMTLRPDILDVLPPLLSTEPFWPAELLRFFARYPHKAATWISYDHTMPVELEPFSGVMFSINTLFPHNQFGIIKTADGKLIHVLSVMPLYPAEMDRKLSKGAEALYALFDKYNIREVCDPDRLNVGEQDWRSHLARWFGRLR